MVVKTFLMENSAPPIVLVKNQHMEFCLLFKQFLALLENFKYESIMNILSKNQHPQ